MEDKESDKMDITVHDGTEFRIKITWNPKTGKLISVEGY